MKTASHMMIICDWIHRKYGDIGNKEVEVVRREKYYVKNGYRLLRLKCVIYFVV